MRVRPAILFVQLFVCLALAASAVASAAHGKVDLGLRVVGAQALPGTNPVRGVVPPAAAQTTPTVTSSVVTVSNRTYTVYDYADPATKKFCVVIPKGLKTVRGLLVQCNYAGGDCDRRVLPAPSRCTG